MHTDDALAPLLRTFPHLAEHEGIHFKYAARHDSVLIETRRMVQEGHRCIACNQSISKERRFYYWLLTPEGFQLIAADSKSKLSNLKTIGDSLRTHA